jgi:hypothetical protein
MNARPPSQPARGKAAAESAKPARAARSAAAAEAGTTPRARRAPTAEQCQADAMLRDLREQIHHLSERADRLLERLA